MLSLTLSHTLSPIEEIEKWTSHSNKDIFSFDSTTHNPFFFCNLKVSSTNFTSCTALGPSLIYGSGGAFYSYSSSVDISECNFSLCTASCGGALSLRESIMNLQSSSFVECSCTFQCGAIYLGNSEKAFIFLSSFINCSAAYTYGAIGAHNCTEVVISDSTFFSNSAQEAGGAVGLRDCGCYLLNVTFTDNSLFGSIEYQDINASRGGGAIIFHMDRRFIQKECWKSRCLITHRCTFEGNMINLSSFFRDTSLKYGGSDITFVGASVWQTKEDSFELSRRVSIQWVPDTVNWTSENAIQVIDTVWGTEENLETVHFSPPPLSFTDELTFEFTEVSHIIYDSEELSDTVPVVRDPSFTIELDDTVMKRAYAISTVCPDCFEVFSHQTSESAQSSMPTIGQIDTPPFGDGNNGNSVLILVLSIVGCVVLIGTVVAITLYFHTSKSDSDSEEEEDISNGGLMQAEVRSIDQAESTVVSQNNPLWDRRGGADISDDPFANDFVEDTMLTIEI